MDVIALHQEGITNAVASLGTAFTDEQAKLVKRYGGKAVLCYDSDEAGRKATLRAGEILSKHDIKTRVLTIDGGKDPDEFVRKKGGDMFRILVDSAKPFIEYRIDEIQKQYIANDGSAEFLGPEEVLEFTEAAARVLADIESPVEYEIYVKRVSEKTGISRESLTATVATIKRGMNAEQGRREEAAVRNRQRAEERSAETDIKTFNAEKLLLSLLCDNDVYNIACRKEITPELFSNGVHRRLAQAIFKMYQETGQADVNMILESFDEGERGNIARLLLDDKNVFDKKRACILPIETILDTQQRLAQNQMLESGDLQKLNELLKKSAKSKKNNGTYRNGGNR